VIFKLVTVPDFADVVSQTQVLAAILAFASVALAPVVVFVTTSAFTFTVGLPALLSDALLIE